MEGSRPSTTGPIHSHHEVSEKIERLVDVLAAHGTPRAIAAMYAIGRVVANALYGGLRTNRRRRTTDVAYLALAVHPRLPISRRDLDRSLTIFELGAQHPHLLTRDDLSLSHFLVLASLDDAARRVLLRSIGESRLSVRQLRAAARRSCPA